jgi:hypothetical protein
MTNAPELNHDLRFNQLTPVQQKSFNTRPTPTLIRFEKGTHLYKWTEFPLIGKRGYASEYWSPWKPLVVGDMHVPGFAELRERYRNLNGGVGRPQQFMRVRNAVTAEWNSMSSLTKAELAVPVWGFLGTCAAQPVTQSEEASRRVLFIGGNYQLVLPNMEAKHIFKL